MGGDMHLENKERLLQSCPGDRRKALVFVGSGVHGELSVAGPRLVTFHPTEEKELPHTFASNQNQQSSGFSRARAHRNRTTKGRVYCGGSNRHGQLGLGIEPPDQADEELDDIEPFAPLAIDEEIRFRSVHTGNASSAALTEEEKLYFWGRLGTTISHYKPTLMPFSSTWRVQQIALGHSHAILLAETPDQGSGVFAWGESDSGALGIAPSEGENRLVLQTPQQIDFFRGDKINCVAAGYSHSGVVTAQRNFYVFGACEYQPTEAQEQMEKKKKKIDTEARPSTFSVDVSEMKSMEPKPAPQYSGLVPDHEPRVVSFLEPGRCKVDAVYLGNEMTLAVIEGLVFGWGSGFCRLLAFADPNHSLSSSSVHLLYANKSDPCIDLS